MIKKHFALHKNNPKVEIVIVLMGGDGGLMRAMQEL